MTYRKDLTLVKVEPMLMMAMIMSFHLGTVDGGSPVMVRPTCAVAAYSELVTKMSENS